MAKSLRRGTIWPNADSATEAEQIPEGRVTGWVSDGTDNYTDGDVVIIVNRDGTPTAAVVGNIDTGDGLVSVDTNVDGTLGGLIGW